MIDINLVREHPERVKDSLTRRGKFEKLDLLEEVVKKHDEWKEVKGMLDELRHKRNTLSEKINAAKKEKKDALAIIQEARQLPEKIKQAEQLEQELREKVERILKTLPNVLHKEVPKGHDATGNVVRETIGTKPTFSFPVKSHVEIAEHLGIADFEAARTVAGSGFFYLKGDLALLDMALQRFGLDIMMEEGFTPVVPPYVTRREIVDGMVDVAFFEEIMFKLEDQDLYPIPTSEFPLVGMLMRKDIDARTLPLKMVGISPCFRAEVGAHGIDEKGLFRTHQFSKIEQVVICKPEESEEWYDKLLGITKRVFKELGLHLRVLEMCAGDLGDLKNRQADIEVWSPRRNDFFEVGSCSNLTDAQARRLGIRMVHPDGTREYAHTLNNTAIATSRAMVAILENFQQEDGSVRIPDVLHKYMYKRTLLGTND